MNFDGASKGNPSLEGLGGIFKDHKGIILRVYAVGIGIATNNDMELRELTQGITISIREGIGKLIVEGDFLIIIHNLGKTLHGSAISKISSGWRMEGGMEILQAHLPKNEAMIPSHVIHYTNKLANKLANEGAEK